MAITSIVWSPSIDGDIELIAKGCVVCQTVKKSHPTEEEHPWEWPSKRWYRIYVDFTGPFVGSMFLILIDAYSKWPEVVQLRTITAQATIDVLGTIFTRNGKPTQLVSDNGPQSTSELFQSSTR